MIDGRWFCKCDQRRSAAAVKKPLIVKVIDPVWYGLMLILYLRYSIGCFYEFLAV